MLEGGGVPCRRGGDVRDECKRPLAHSRAPGPGPPSWGLPAVWEVTGVWVNPVGRGLGSRRTPDGASLTPSAAHGF